MFSLITVMLLGAQAGSASCEKLAALALPNTMITSAQLVPAGPFTPTPQGPPGGPVGERRQEDEDKDQPRRQPRCCPRIAVSRSC
jgi:hypothetical protein